MSWDVTLFFFLNSFAGRSAALDDVIVFTASYLPYILVGIFVLYLALRKGFSLNKKIWAFVMALLAALIARIGIGSPIRYFFPRARPFLTYHVHQLIPENSPTFPSGHALFFFAFSTVVYTYNKKLGILSFCLTTLICVARVAAGIHYPSDILAGAIIGISCGYLTIMYIEPFLKKFFV